jgi:hypothetical protein
MKKEKSVKSASKAGKGKKEHRCLCPYCEEELVIAGCPFCHACGAVISYCVSCGVIVSDVDAAVCPECGAPLKKERRK